MFCACAFLVEFDNLFVMLWLVKILSESNEDKRR